MILEVVFRLNGSEIPIDHGYGLYSSISRILPELHEVDWLAIHPIRGLFVGNGILKLTEVSRLGLRIPHEQIPKVLPLAGKRLSLFNQGKEYQVLVGVPEVFQLSPASRLFSNCVVFRHSEVEKTNQPPTKAMFVTTLEKHLAELGIAAEIVITDKTDLKGRDLSRRIISIKNRKVVGYRVELQGLKEEDSFKLQEIGLGGRRKMGCGIFIPMEEKK